MMRDRERAKAYLRAPANAVWHWEDQGSTLVWVDGSTIGFREEVAQILETFQPGRLPPFNSLVLLLAACKGKLSHLKQTPGLSPSALALSQVQASSLLKSCQEGLNVLENLPAELIGTGRGKAILARAVFEEERDDEPESGPVLRGILERFDDHELNQDRQVFSRTVEVCDLKRLAKGLQRHTRESLEMRLRTGLDKLPAPAEVDLPCAERARLLLEELARDNEHAGLARVTRELMAAIRLPQRLAEADALPVGGVADLSNRGSLDRLLISELVHDDMTLAARIALGEALYLRREPPMLEPPKTLAILLDCGLRLWGLPRVFATAVALALLAHDTQLRHVQIWRAHKNELVPVDLLTRAGLVQHLAALETEAHPGEALPAFAEALPKNVPIQSLLITARDTLADPAFCKILSEARPGPDLIVTVDRDGGFELHTWPRSSWRPLSSASLNIADLFQEPKPSASLVDSSRLPRLPLIFDVRPFPIRLPVPKRMEAAKPSRPEVFEGGIGVTQDHRVLSWANRILGAQQLGAGIPGRRTLWLHQHGDGQVSLVRLDEEKCRDILVWVPGHADWTTHDLGRSVAGTHFRAEDTVLLALAPGMVRAVNILTGAVLDVKKPHAGITHCGGRFWRGESRWSCAGWDGQQITWEPVTMAASILREEALLLFDCDLYREPLVLTRHGSVLTTTGKIVVECKRRLVSGVCSPDGFFVLAQQHGGAGAVLFDLPIQRWLPQPVSANLPSIEASMRMPSRPLWQNVEAISVRSPSLLTLYTNGNSGLRLASDLQGLPQLSRFEVAGPRPSGVRCFQPISAPPRLGCELGMVKWPSGSRAFLDSRGLLHLVSAEPAAPEVCLVLCEGPLTGWASDGLQFGEAFFVNQREFLAIGQMRLRLEPFFKSAC